MKVLEELEEKARAKVLAQEILNATKETIKELIKETICEILADHEFVNATKGEYFVVNKRKASVFK